MEQFVVSARKYRPQHFNTVVGQSHITNTLKNAIAGHQLAQAYLFCGPRGVGKTTCARIFAKTINCTSISADGEACDACESCNSFNSGASLNVYELDAASNNSVEDIRALVDQVRFAPQLGEYKVYIIDEVHMLSNQAFNAFLKTLEEPPKHAKFILATTEKHKIIPTILSRCQVFNFNRIKAEDISRHLEYMAKNEGVTYEPEALQVIAQKADGGLRDACSIFDQMVAFTGNNLSYKQVVENLNVLDYDYYFKITDSLIQFNIPEALLTLDTILNKGFDGHNFITGLGEHLRNLLVGLDNQTLSLLEVSESLRKRYVAQAALCKQMFLIKALAIISKADVDYKSARNQRLLTESTLIQIAYLTAPQDAEKKNDDSQLKEESLPPAETKPKPISPLSDVLKEPEIKTATKPTIPYDQLRIKSGFSLNEARQFQSQPVTVAPINDSVPEAVTNNRELNEQEVQDYIQQYAEAKLKQGARQIATIFKTAKLEFLNNRIKLLLQNETQKEQLMAMKQDFVDTVRRDLQNQLLYLEVDISHIETKTKAYKPADIFKAMTEKNPALMELKKRFDLEIDY